MEKIGVLKKILVFALLMVCCVSYAGEKFTVRADVWMPYNGEPGSDRPGYGIEVLNAIFAPLNIEVDYQTMPWNRAVADARKGDFDSLVGAGIRDAEGFIFPTEKMGVMTAELFVKAGSDIKCSSIEDLKALKIGIIADYSYSEELDAYIAENKDNAERFFVATGEDALEKLAKMVSAGRIKGFLENPMVVAQNAWKADVVSAGRIGGEDDLFFALSPARESSKKYAEIIDKGIKELRSSGKLKEILDKYSISDWVK